MSGTRKPYLFRLAFPTPQGSTVMSRPFLDEIERELAASTPQNPKGGDADPNVRDPETGMTLLHTVVEMLRRPLSETLLQDYFKLLFMLKRAGADPTLYGRPPARLGALGNVRSALGEALHPTVHLPLFQALLETPPHPEPVVSAVGAGAGPAPADRGPLRRVDTSIRDGDGWTPLMHALVAQGANGEAAVRILCARSEVDMTDEGRTLEEFLDLELPPGRARERKQWVQMCKNIQVRERAEVPVKIAQLSREGLGSRVPPDVEQNIASLASGETGQVAIQTSKLAVQIPGQPGVRGGRRKTRRHRKGKKATRRRR